MKPILFVTATAKEMKAALGGVCKLPALKQGRVAEFMFGDRPGLLLVTGIGVINTSFALGQALAGNDVGMVVLAGIAGTFNAEPFPLCSACVVKKEIWPEYGLKKDGHVDPKGLGFSLAEIDGQPVWNEVKLCSGKSLFDSGLDRFENLPEAVSLTVSGVTATAEGAAAYRNEYAADIENMEGFAAAYVCALVGVGLCQVRTVSNLVGSRDSDDWDLRGALAELGRVCSVLLK
ncbi:futalosine hydrolase [Desulfovibrio sp. JC010]|uniref:futalosine hydrolase n=1 Tax=Desulfovibrio sp. JC010 TaxID=2593641 RepID=UPI0013D18689|nr:futalosine hydrolase [Desulfovibrio sp. JC010]NDV25369.1 futalosine hydrolase [Desulfovibrio sp. JC010]